MKRFSNISMTLVVMVVIGMLFSTSAYAGGNFDPELAGISTNVTDPAVQVASDRSKTIIGYDHMYGKDTWIPTEWQSPSCENTVNRFSIRYETNKFFSQAWDKWFLGGEFYYSMHKADEKPAGSYHMGHDAGFREYSFNLTIKRQMFNDLFYLGWVMGLSYWYERDHGMHNLGDSHVLGSWGPTLGKDWHIYKAWSVRTELRLTHTSDPFRSDRGKNYGTGVVGVSYEF